MMPKKIIPVSIILLLILIAIVYFFFSPSQNITAMDQKLCEEQGGTWDWMEIMRDAEDGGHDLFYQCFCPNNGPWIREGGTESCN